MTSYLGHDKPRQIFRQSLAKNMLHHAWILAGDKGLGKAGFAQQAAHFLLNSRNLPAEFSVGQDDEAGHLLAAGSHPDFRLLRRGPKGDKEEKKARDNGLDSLAEHELARNIKVEQIRALQPLFQNQTSISEYRVVVIDAADDLESSGANALLKNLEEPPKKTIFFLISHMPDRLLPTIRSRCQMLRFDPLSDEDMRIVLKKTAPRLSDADLEALVVAGEGSPGRALKYVEVGLAELEGMAREIIKSGDRDNRLKSDLARKLSLKAATPRYRAFLERAPSLIAEQIKGQQIACSVHAIEKWREASDLAAAALPKALDNQAVIFRLGSLMADLAQENPAK
ncbi:MAG: DNA polymerase III subunit delta' [Sphingomonadales bacterium]|nr:DNA polymerase III subunit delta' [Sphingomonadales bacterium]PIX66017.1 MAG: DNA polymerase III subunit delta' [Sphingomonadales bacterium CG_4_10_14_3_um_filter_58_15]NCO50327.1 DNA polymerase III subunit delta' [Sphingomonadales bacterium]NCP00310.1 DNA polymerase III subunit delta' [Sphingomonadales bacterium]NCP26007.1 DNA polymerase III subunit delta' [Sphingomonadales bacterium]